MSHEPLNTALAVLGAILQLVGFALAVLVASAARYSEYGDAGLLRRGWLRVRAYWHKPSPVPLSTSMTATGSLSGNLTVSVPPGTETDIERLNREVRELRATQERYQSETTTKLVEMQTDCRLRADESANRIRELQDHQDNRRRQDLRREVRASLLFLVGTLLTIAAYLV